MVVVEVALGLAIGLSLGLMGGGGSILTVPALVYIVGQTPQVAVTASLVIVGANSAAGVFFHRTHGTLNWQVAVLFGSAGMVMAYLGAGLSRLLPSEILMLLFALLMLFVGAFMILRQQMPDAQGNMHGWPVIVLSGGLAGLMTGFLGVGGGFLIVPALVLLVGLPMHQAVGTSLLIIAMNSLAGFLGHIGDISLDFAVIAIFAISGILGTYIGSRLAQHIRPRALSRFFALFIIILALYLLQDNLTRVFSPTV